jgi:methionine synthase II (cobalamin-independent)
MLAGWKQDSKNSVSADELLDMYIELYNGCIAKIPADMHIGVHLCRGNFVNSRHFSEGGYVSFLLSFLLSSLSLSLPSPSPSPLPC